jgi:hypothetical protein
MKTAIPLAMLVVVIVAAVVMFGEKSIQTRGEALMIRAPERAETTQQGGISETMQSVETTTQAVAGAPDEVSTKPRHRGVYRPRRHDVSKSKTAWVRVPGTGIGLWPKPTG